MNMDDIPRRRDDVRYAELENEAVLYDQKTRQAVYLNAPAAIVWKLCDGTLGIEDMAMSIAAETAGDSVVIAADIAEIVGKFRTAGLMIC
jgi:hypothetical protein